MLRCKTNYLSLQRPCAVDDGIKRVSLKEKKKLIALFEQGAGKYKLLKFVPASGAASRMFADWFTAMEKGGFSSELSNRRFLRNLEQLPFFSRIKNDSLGKKLLAGKKIAGLLKFVLTEDGLNYGALPKALIPFHGYPQGEARTALEEHLGEAARYLRNSKNICRIHFTTSSEHRKKVSDYFKKKAGIYEKLYGVGFQVSWSVQEPATETIAVDENDLPLCDQSGRLVFRPGGHGALLANLQSLDADFIFIKNIDNVAPRPLLERNLPYKMLLGGLAFKIREDIWEILCQLEKGEPSAALIENIVRYCKETVNIVFPPCFAGLTKKKKIAAIFSVLNRPLRICGVVKNIGEPGGGPFWVNEADGTQTPQIVENGHVDKNNKKQLAVWRRAGYFNPGDMVCCIRNYRGEKFRLEKYVNQNAYLISAKKEKGRSLKALELPGLWNGGMAYWNTVFVELPLMVFNPVKTVDDLLRPEHRKTS